MLKDIVYLLQGKWRKYKEKLYKFSPNTTIFSDDIAYEQRCNISDMLDAMLEQANWKEVTQEASNKPAQRAKERGGKY